jgi:hypothetical protein
MTIIQVEMNGMELLSESVSTVPQAVTGSRVYLGKLPGLF